MRITTQLAVEETLIDKTEETNHPNGTATVPQAPAGAVDKHTTTNEHISISKHMFQRLLQKEIIANDQQMNRPRSMVESCRPLEEILINFAEEDNPLEFSTI
jgi:hypothetical protein